MRREFRYAISAGCASILAGLALLPESTWTAVPSVCIWRTMCDWECFGCGMTRALAAAAHGRLDAALEYNRGVVAFLPLVLGGVLQIFGAARESAR